MIIRSRLVDGSSTQTYPLAQYPGIVLVNFQKDSSNDARSDNGTITLDISTLTVQIIDQNGNAVETQSTLQRQEL